MSALKKKVADDQESEIDSRYDRQMKKSDRGGGSCCSCTKFLVFILFLGGALGAIFGLIDIEQIENFFTGGSSSPNTNSTDASGVSKFEFMQCPETGECCNGLQSNCDLRLDEIMFATLHNANHDKLLVPNHEAPLEGALEVGYRGLFLDVCKCQNPLTNSLEITFCHGVCGVGNRDPTEVFANVNTFLDNNPSEVILINFEMSVGDPSPSDIWNVMISNDALRKKTLNYDGKAWPTMRTLLDTGKQVVAFAHNVDCTTDPKALGCVPGRISNFFTYAVETQWDFPDVAAIKNYDTSCAEDRGANGLKNFYSVNHFVTGTFGPSKSSASTINKLTEIKNRVEACEAKTGHRVNILSIDFWQRGDLPEYTQTVNIARSKPKRSRFLRWLFG